MQFGQNKLGKILSRLVDEVCATDQELDAVSKNRINSGSINQKHHIVRSPVNPGMWM